MDSAPLVERAAESSSNQQLFFHYHPRPAEDVIGELLAGLGGDPKRISPKYFYDSRGAALFDRITEQPEYYLTRVERRIYLDFARSIADEVGSGRVLVEPGSGSSEKVELLLDALQPAAYVPVEITESHLRRAAHHLAVQYPWLEVHAVCADYSGGMNLPDALPEAPRLLFFPGSTIGNFEPDDARRFLGHLRRASGEEGALLIGVDLRKDTALLNAAYNDAEGVTAAFNLNVLDHINRIAGTDFDCSRFNHQAFFNEAESRIEMHLASDCAQTVSMGDVRFHFAEGETIHTENSYKYSLEEFRQLAISAGFEPRDTWVDEHRLFSVHLLDAA